MESLKRFSKKRKLSFVIQFSVFAVTSTLLALKFSNIVFNLYLLEKVKAQVPFLEGLVLAIFLIGILIYTGIALYEFPREFDELPKFVKLVFLFSAAVTVQFILYTLINVLAHYVPWIHKFIFKI